MFFYTISTSLLKANINFSCWKYSIWNLGGQSTFNKHIIFTFFLRIILKLVENFEIRLDGFENEYSKQSIT